MGIYRRYRGQKLSLDHADWDKGTWYMYKRILGKAVHRALPEAVTEQDALSMEQAIVEKALRQAGYVGTVAAFKFQAKLHVPKPKYLYLLESGGYYKIGHTTRIRERIAALGKTIIPFDTNLVLAVQHAGAIEAEKDLHWTFRNYRIKGEWFALDEAQVEQVKQLMVA